MYYTPHTLYKKSETLGKDKYGRPTESVEEWVEIGKCRCDDNSIQEFHDENGKVYRPHYKIVANRDVNVKVGDFVKVEPNRAEGRVFNVTHLNYLNYSTIWL